MSIAWFIHHRSNLPFNTLSPLTGVVVDGSSPVLREDVMANYELVNTNVDDILITVIDDAGDKVAAIAGDTYAVVSSDPAMVNAVIGTMPSGSDAGAPSLRINAVKRLSKTPVTATVSDVDGLRSFVLVIDVVNDVTPKALDLDTVNVIHTTQDIPPA